jgi:8-oxo-dGTP pyrophosphatase MutT (NUDIX family)
VAGPKDLSRIVLDYQPTGGEQSHAAALAVLRSAGLGWLRSEYEPGHFTASGFVLSPDAGSLLLILHEKLDRWLQPGGHIEADDVSIEAAARREIAEETGVVDLTRLGQSLVRIDAHVIPERSDEPQHTHFDLGVGFQAASWEIGPINEVLDARWVKLADLASYDTDNAVRESAHLLTKMVGNAATVSILAEPQ